MNFKIKCVKLSCFQSQNKTFVTKANRYNY